MENRTISKRLGDMTKEAIERRSLAIMANGDLDENTSVSSSMTPTIRQGALNQDPDIRPRGFAFEEDLLTSRVYCRPYCRESSESLATSAIRATASSILSALSLTDVSNISILAVPIYVGDIKNSKRYTFGNSTQNKPETEQDRLPTALGGALEVNGWARFTSAVRRGRQEKRTEEALGLCVQGPPLHESIKCAHVVVRITGESDVYEPVPIFVAMPVLFIKKHGQY